MPENQFLIGLINDKLSVVVRMIVVDVFGFFVSIANKTLLALIK